MPKFMINIFYGSKEKREESSHPADIDFVMKKYGEWTRKMAEKVVVTHALTDGVGRRLELVEGKIQDGPYAETKESIGGFYIVNAQDYGEAVELAKECPTLLYQGGHVEVREVEF